MTVGVEEAVAGKTSLAGPGTGRARRREAPPCTVVALGARGDLSRRKLLPALYHLALDRLLPPSVTIVGMARQELDDAAFRESVRGDLASAGAVEPEAWRRFSERLFYLRATSRMRSRIPAWPLGWSRSRRTCPRAPRGGSSTSRCRRPSTKPWPITWRRAGPRPGCRTPMTGHGCAW